MRVGIGYDVHSLVKGRKLIIGGVNIPYKKGLLGHSDGDVFPRYNTICKPHLFRFLHHFIQMVDRS